MALAETTRAGVEDELREAMLTGRLVDWRTGDATADDPAHGAGETPAGGSLRRPERDGQAGDGAHQVQAVVGVVDRQEVDVAVADARSWLGCLVAAGSGRRAIEGPSMRSWKGRGLGPSTAAPDSSRDRR